MEEGGQGRESWMRRLAGRVDYAWTLARLWVWDWIAGPLPETDGDIVREHEKERLRRAFPDVDVDGAGPQRGARRRRSRR